ncbi:MAG: hypothetical protein J2P41_04480, partial [Blastocatellia bacterium]|nr:hypothetical protein [Blastocatellia bacterium]
MQKRATSHKGNLSELKVITAYVEAGFTVSIPFGGGAQYDLIVDTRLRLLKIQVKTGRLRNGCILFPTMRFSGQKGKGCRYEPGEIDLFAIFCPDNEHIYVMTLDQSLTEGRIRCSAAKNGQLQKIKWASEYEFYKHIDIL